MNCAQTTMGGTLAAVLWLSSCATPEPPKTVIGSTTTANVVPVVATVEGLDEKNRVLALRDANGETRTLNVDPAVASLQGISRGDRVTAVYLEPVVVRLEAPGVTGGLEGAGALPTVQQRVVVEDIDDSDRILTLHMPEGSLRAIRVSPQVGPLDRIRKGDQIVVRYTQAVAVCLSKVE